jgi:hypothetical protein
MRRFGIMVSAGLVFLTGCAAAERSADAGKDAARGTAAITYEETPCFGFCPVFTATVNAEGQGTFEGREHVAQKGRREFRISSAQFEALESQLAPLRPPSGDVSYDHETRCQGGGTPPTDGSSTVIVWHDAQGGQQTMRFYSGCPQDDIGTRLHDARGMLPIGDFIGTPAR